MNAHPDGGTIHFDVGAQTACKFVAAPPPAREMRLCVRLRDARMTLDMGCSVHIAGAAPAGREKAGIAGVNEARKQNINCACSGSVAGEHCADGIAELLQRTLDGAEEEPAG